MAKTYNFLFKIRSNNSPHRNVRMVDFDHENLTPEDLKIAEQKIDQYKVEDLKDAYIESYILNTISDSVTQRTYSAPDKCRYFIGKGNFTYKVVYYRHCLHDVTHGYAVFTLDHEINQFTQDNDYHEMVQQIYDDIGDVLSHFKILLRGPVNQ